MEKQDCIFCRIIRGEIKSDIIYTDDNFIGILDINPEVENHALVIPKKHFKTILDIPSSLGNEYFDAIKNVSLDLIKKTKADGFNVVFNNHESAGQVVNHVHAHIFPRRKNDGRKLIVRNGLKDRGK